MDIEALLAEKSGIRLDIGAGRNVQEGFVGMDKQDLGQDIVHDWNDYPWPLPDECVLTALASHVVEHVNPADGNFLRWMDEVWRICKVGAEFAIVYPHGSSQGYLQDPTHCNALNENTWFYFDPDHPLYEFYRPKPWKIKVQRDGTMVRFWTPNANVEVVLIKVAEVNHE